MFNSVEALSALAVKEVLNYIEFAGSDYRWIFKQHEASVRKRVEGSGIRAKSSSGFRSDASFR